MDLRLLLRVLFRFRALVAAGFALSVVVAMLSYARVTWNGAAPGLAYRDPVLYESDSTLFVTQPGFPWGRATVDPNEPPPDPNRFANLAIVYSQFANSDAVRHLVRIPEDASYKAVPVPAEGGGFLPFIEIQGTSPSSQSASSVAALASSALRQYIDVQQRANQIASQERVVLQPLARPTSPRAVKKPSATRPVFLFILMMTLVVGLAFILENLRPRFVLGPVPDVLEPDSDSIEDEPIVKRSAGR
jgi:hypothetical protein